MANGGNFGSECFESFFNSEALSDRILSIVEVEEIYCVSYNEETLNNKIGYKRKHKTSEQASTCIRKKFCRNDEPPNETCFTQYDEEVSVGSDGINVCPSEETVEVKRSESRGNEEDEVQDGEIIVEQEELDIVESQCEPVECKEEVADQIDDAVGGEGEKSDNENENDSKSDMVYKSTKEKQIDYSHSSPYTLGCKSSKGKQTDYSHSAPCTLGCKSSKEKEVEYSQSTPSTSKQTVVLNDSPSDRLPGAFHSMHVLCDNRGNIRNIQAGEDIIEKQVLKETTVFVHSVILAAKSDFFNCLFATSGMKETKEQKVKVEVQKDETETMLILLHCFYNKNFINTHSLQTVLKVCPLAMRYCYDGLIDKCLDVFRLRAESLSEVDDVNQIAYMVSKIQNALHQHKDKCLKVMKTFGPFLINTFYPLDECLEKNPGRFFQLTLNSMYLLLDPMVQGRFNSEHGNLFVYAVQRWLKNHTHCFQNPIFKADVIVFIEKLLCGININDLTGDFLSNIMTYEHCPFAIWLGYKEWYIKALQDFVFKYYACNNSITEKQYPIIIRNRVLKFVRQERNADIFALSIPIILNGFEIGIYLRAREDRKVQIIGKCKNMIVNKTGFDKASLTFNLKGTIKLNVESHLWIEHFPSSQSQWLHEWLTFSYKQNLMCLQMYGVCKLSPAVYNLAKSCGFRLALELQQMR